MLVNQRDVSVLFLNHIIFVVTFFLLNTEKRGGRIDVNQLPKVGQAEAMSFNNDQYILCNYCYSQLIEESPHKNGNQELKQASLPPPLPAVAAASTTSYTSSASASSSRTTSSAATLQREIPINNRAPNYSDDMNVDAEQIMLYHK